ncbi:hypothetical protein [Nocardioides bruguierae]|uniref:Uncharacterized protein n=1 Tax=Nocardioides bruguierae TaxID=2945102 RepID=A0A9X2DB59_9ACTN|nr:hypothetical protein [Nocardioides bruguierae]MCM0622740.1 hypothetical protein [Nocardioides bruguierae]
MSPLGWIQRCYASEDFNRRLGSGLVDIARIFDDLALIEFGSATVQVQGQSVRGCAIDYEGVSFVGGYDPIRWPFVIARRSSSTDAWPELVRV